MRGRRSCRSRRRACSRPVPRARWPRRHRCVETDGIVADDWSRAASMRAPSSVGQQAGGLTTDPLHDDRLAGASARATRPSRPLTMSSPTWWIFRVMKTLGREDISNQPFSLLFCHGVAARKRLHDHATFMPGHPPAWAHRVDTTTCARCESICYFGFGIWRIRTDGLIGHNGAPVPRSPDVMRRTLY